MQSTCDLLQAALPFLAFSKGPAVAPRKPSKHYRKHWPALPQFVEDAAEAWEKARRACQELVRRGTASRAGDARHDDDWRLWYHHSRILWEAHLGRWFQGCLPRPVEPPATEGGGEPHPRDAAVHMRPPREFRHLVSEEAQDAGQTTSEDDTESMNDSDREFVVSSPSLPAAPRGGSGEAMPCPDSDGCGDRMLEIGDDNMYVTDDQGSEHLTPEYVAAAAREDEEYMRCVKRVCHRLPPFRQPRSFWRVHDVIGKFEHAVKRQRVPIVAQSRVRDTLVAQLQRQGLVLLLPPALDTALQKVSLKSAASALQAPGSTEQWDEHQYGHPGKPAWKRSWVAKEEQVNMVATTFTYFSESHWARMCGKPLPLGVTTASLVAEAVAMPYPRLLLLLPQDVARLQQRVRAIAMNHMQEVSSMVG